MLLERTLTTLQSRADTPERADELGRLGYMQWLMLLPSGDSYPAQARRALALAAPFEGTDPAVAVFAGLMRRSLTEGCAALSLTLPVPQRRGGARARRELL